MAKIIKINDVELKDIQMSDFADFFTQHIFFKFMDAGRDGMKEGVHDLIDTSIARVVEHLQKDQLTNHPHTAKATGSRERMKKISSEEFFKTMYDFNMPRILSSFVTGGTKEMRSAIFACATDPLMFE